MIQFVIWRGRAAGDLVRDYDFACRASHSATLQRLPAIHHAASAASNTPDESTTPGSKKCVDGILHRLHGSADQNRYVSPKLPAMIRCGSEVPLIVEIREETVLASAVLLPGICTPIAADRAITQQFRSCPDTSK